MAMSLEEKRARRAKRKESANRCREAREKAQKIVSTGVCPVCGGGISRNLSLSGWWQCNSFGSDGFREDGKKASEKPPCGFQCFTE